MKIFSLLLLLALRTETAHAVETLKLTAQPIPFFIESEERGTFIDLTKEIAKKLGIQITVEVYPTVRAIDLFKKGRSMGFLPGSHPKLEKHSYFETEPIFYKKTYIYSKAPESFSSLKDLAHKRVGVTIGYTYPPELAIVKGVEIQEAANDEGNLRKLHAGRIDAFLGEEVSVNDGIASLGFTEIGYKKEKYLTKEPIFYAFQKSPEGERWFKKFNETIHLMKKNGALDKIVLKK
jgi:polar amino acid transport system substrate-binding protein